MAELWPGGPINLPHTITHDGVEVTIPEVAVNDLLYWLSTAQWWQLYPNAVDPEALAPLHERILDPDDPFDLIHLADVARTVFGRLASTTPKNGTGWWPAVRLAFHALDQWSLFNAWCVHHAVDPLARDLGHAIGAAYAWRRDGLPPEHLAEFEKDLWSVPALAARAPKVAAARATPAPAEQEIPEHVREQEAGAFLAALGEQFPGERVTSGVH